MSPSITLCGRRIGQESCVGTGRSRSDPDDIIVCVRRFGDVGLVPFRHRGSGGAEMRRIVLLVVGIVVIAYLALSALSMLFINRAP